MEQGRGATLTETQEELKKYQERSLTYAPAYQRLTEDRKLLAGVRQKAPIIFPQFADIEGAAVPQEDKEGKISYHRFFALVHLKSPLTPEEEGRFKNWLDKEISLPTEILFRVEPAPSGN